jgi:hypothetical protein
MNNPEKLVKLATQEKKTKTTTICVEQHYAQNNTFKNTKTDNTKP